MGGKPRASASRKGGFWTRDGSIANGVVRYHDLAYAAVTDDVGAGATIVVWDRDRWVGEGDSGKGWPVVGMTVTKKPLEQALALGRNGQVYCIGSGDHHDEQIDDNSRIEFRGIRGIGDCAFAVGMHRVAYRRNQIGQWQRTDTGMRSTRGPVVGLEAVDGFSETDVYAVGWNGEIWRFDGAKWRQCRNIPTEAILVDVCCAGDGKVYACGRGRVLLAGLGDHWAIVDNEAVVDSVWSLAWFQGALYLATMSDVFVMDERGKAFVCNMGRDRASTCYRLSAADGVLWSFGAKDIMAFDGHRWSRID